MTAIMNMFCKNCGNQLTQGDLFCASCGTRVEAVPVNDTPVENAYAAYPQEQYAAQSTEQGYAQQEYDNAYYAQQGYDNSYYAQQEYAYTDYAQQSFAQPNFNAYAQKPKKKSPAVLVAIVAVLCACAFLLVTNASALKGTFLRTVGSEAKYYQYVETTSISSGSSRVVEQYGNIVDDLSKTSLGTEATIKLNVSDDVISMLETSLSSLANSKMELDWLKNIGLDLNVNNKDDLMQLVAGVNLNGEKIVDMDCIMDMDKSQVFIGAKELNSKYLQGDLGDLGVSMPSFSDYFSDGSLQKALPTEDELNKLINKYTKAVIHNINNVKKSKETVTVGDISQKLTALTVEIDFATAQNIARDVLETAKQDKDLKKHIENIAAYLKDKNLIPDASGIYSSFTETIDDLLEDLNDATLSADDDEVLVLTNYINSDHEIVGRTLKSDKVEVLRYIEVRDGKKFAAELVATGLSIYGEGTEKNDIINGEFSVTVSNKTLVTVTLSDFDIDADTPNGTIRLAPSSELLKEMGLDSSAMMMLSLSNPTLELKMKSDDNSANFDINLLSKNSLFCGISISAKETKADNIKTPDSKNVYSEDQAYKWASEMDFSKVIAKLKKAGVPNELITILEANL